jgi:hypothetical protein
MRPSLRLLLLGLLVAAVLTGGVVVVGTLVADEEESPASEDEPYRTTALEDFDTEGLVVRRASFCSAIDQREVEAALGTDAESERAWGNGDRIEVSDGARDVVHEFGCEYVGGDITASAWVFAPPVSARRARQLASKTPTQGGVCAKVHSSAFGDPSAAWSCLEQGETVSTFVGRFGDAWLTCRLRNSQAGGDPIHLHDRAGRWCVGVAQAASSAPVADS